MTATHSVDAVLDKLASGPWRLVGLPTLRGRGLYFIAVTLGDEPTYAWFSLDDHRSASRTEFFDRAGAAAFLAEYERGGYSDELLQPWDRRAEPAPELLRAALVRCRRVLAELRAKPGLVAMAMETGWLERSADVGWIVNKRYDSGLRGIPCSEERAASELLTQILRHDLQLQPGTPPAELAAEIEAERARRSQVFAIHGPAPDRLFLRSAEGQDARGFMRFADGVHAFVALDAEGRLRSAELWPEDEAFALIFRDEKGVLPTRSQALGEALQAELGVLRDLEALAAMHERGAIRLRCGAFARGGFTTLDAHTLLDGVRDVQLPVREVLRRFMDGRGFVEVRIQEQVPPSVEARAEDDPDSTDVRYLFPKVWLQRLSRERVFEVGFGAALAAAIGVEVGALERGEERVESGPYRSDGRRVTLRCGEAEVVIRGDAIESGHGVHGESVDASFRGLPEGLKLTGSGRIDMRGGGHLALTIAAGDGELGPAIKAAVLAALP